ncbi:SPOR domain-containing protein [Hydrogenophilus thiooxidans]|uniref:SPOR domain-containing protein n=1 Tax=Hydrogenophilus thiooxidans TaxID=2820326 RepID=UPI001C216C77|nr:SPOR domain-containing protein [Hydrogenophilus thiooxidans]
MARHAAHHESVTDPVASSPSEALLRARRRFFGTLALFGLSLLVLPFVMDSEPPASLPAPTVRFITEKQEVITLRPGTEAITRSDSDANAPAPSDLPASSTEGAPADAAPRSAVEPTPGARAEPAESSASSSGKTPEKGRSSQQSGTQNPQNAAHDRPSQNGQKAAHERTEASVPSATKEVAQPKKNVPIWSEAKISDTAKAQAALQGISSPQQPLTQFWYVQAGAFKEEAQAIRAVEQLRRAGYPAYLMSAQGGWYRIRVAPFVTEADAEAVTGKIAALVGGKPRVGAQRIAQ